MLAVDFVEDIGVDTVGRYQDIAVVAEQLQDQQAVDQDIVHMDLDSLMQVVVDLVQPCQADWCAAEGQQVQLAR